jgi:type I restriction enzyme S subunit
MATFGDIAKGFDYGMNAAAKSFDGNNKYIRITDIDEVSSQYLYDDVVSPDGELEDRYLVKENDILLARTGASTGKSYLYRNSDGKLYFAGFLIRANIYKHNSYFVFSQLHTLRYKKWISVMSARSGQPGINSQEYASFPVYTTSLQEEDKIATFLKLLDERIITQNKIIEDLKKLKSAISKHLFARKDLLETTICLSNIATLKNGYAFQSGKYNALGKWKILTITNVSGERYINDEDYNCIINLPNDIQDHQVLKEGDILISLTGNVGRVSLCKDGDYLLNQRVGLLQLAKNVNQEFLYQILSSQRFENSMIACGQGAAQMNIGKGDVESYVLPYSSNVNNILLVAKILHSYDEYIINEQRKLTLLTMQKQYFLAQMFI